MSIKIEVKVDSSHVGKSARSIRSITCEPIWLDWLEFTIIPNRDRNRHLVSNGTLAFQILKSKSRKKYLEEHGYHADAVWEPQEVSQQ